MIELKNLCCGYDGEDILTDVSTVFEDSKVTVLLGPNGSGKSTLIETIIGLNKRLGGDIIIDGCQYDTLSSTERARKVAYMAQNRVIPHITAKKMVLHGRFPHLSYPRKYKKEDYKIADQALEAVDGKELAYQQMDTMSGGQRQKIYIAMAIAQQTKTLFMDEPTNFLDVHNQIELLSLARKLADEGKAVVLVLHDIRFAFECADEIKVIHNGRIDITGSPEIVFESGKIDGIFKVKLNRFKTENGYKYYYE